MRKTAAIGWIFVALVLVGGSWDLGHASGAEALPPKLTPATYDSIKARVMPKPDDLAWQHLHWRDGFFDGLLAAQAEDKPLFYWIYEGDPRASC